MATIQHGQPTMVGDGPMQEKGGPYVETHPVHPHPAPQYPPGHFEDWPTEPVPLRKPIHVIIFQTFYDLALCLIPVLMLIKVGFCLYLRGEWPDDWRGQVVLKINGQLVSLFGIIFTMTAATLVKRLALYMAQRGSYVDTLEQLNASISLTSTVKTMLSLRAFGIRSIGLLCLWSFYYLGSQSARREFFIGKVYYPWEETIAYLDMFQGSKLTNASEGSTLSLANAVYTAAILESREGLDKAVDGWSNVKIPYQDILQYEYNTSYGSIPNATDWVPVIEWEVVENTDYEGLTYSSLIGLPVLGAFDNSINMTVDSFYYYLYCTDPFAVSNDSFPDLTTLQTYSDPPTPDEIQTLAFEVHNSSAEGTPSFTLWSLMEGDQAAQSTCYVYAMEVQSHVKYVDYSNSSITEQRLLQQMDVIDFAPFDTKDHMNVFLQSLALAATLPTTESRSTLTEYYLISFTLTDQTSRIDLTATGGGGISRYFGQILNTYYMATINASTITGAIDYGRDSDVAVQNLLDHRFTNTSFLKPEAVKDDWVFDQFSVSFPWIVIDIIACAVLFLAALIAAVLRHLIIAPDVFGFVSSLTRDNPHLVLPPGGSALDGFERARRLGKIKVRLGDAGHGNVGKVALTVVTEEEQKRRSGVLNPKKGYL